MTKEYDARSRVPNENFKRNFDDVFGKAKAQRAERAEKRRDADEAPRCSCQRWPFEHTKRSTCP